MLIPIGHENMAARRWPVITIGLIVLNAVILVITNAAIDKESPELGARRPTSSCWQPRTPSSRCPIRSNNW